MSELLLGWPNGTLGMLLGFISGLLIIGQAWRDKPWDIHDSHSYEEPARWTPVVAVPTVALLGVLMTIVFGLGALDRDIDTRWAMVGDYLGLVLLPLTVWNVWYQSQQARRPG
jgi:hypothetical protein